MNSGNVIISMTFQFTLDIIAFTGQLETERKYHLANQLFRCGTSIGACVREAQGSESKADFVHKCKIAYKEAEETRYWLELCARATNYPDPKRLLQQIEAILKVLGKMIYTSKT
jgi:four helix bundle protein